MVLNDLNLSKYPNLTNTQYQESNGNLWKPSFKNGSFKICAFNCPPWLKVDKFGRVYGGVQFYILKHLVDQWPIKWKMLPPFSWDDCLERLVNKKSDLAICGHIRADAAEFNLDYTPTFLEAEATLLVPKPTLLPEETFVFQPFQVNLWIIISLSIFIIAGVFNGMLRHGFVKLAIDVLGTIFQNARSIWNREKLFIFVNIFSLLLSTYYSAGFTTILTAPRYSRPIETFKDIFDSSLTHNIPWLAHFLKDAVLPYARIVANSSKHYSLTKEGHIYPMRRVNGFKLIIDKTLTKIKKQKLKVIFQYYDIYNYVHLLQKNSPYTNYFSITLERYVESGLVNFWLKLTLFEEMSDLEDSDTFASYYTSKLSSGNPIAIKKLIGLLYLLFIGNFVSTLFFIYEIGLLPKLSRKK